VLSRINYPINRMNHFYQPAYFVYFSRSFVLVPTAGFIRD